MSSENDIPFELPPARPGKESAEDLFKALDALKEIMDGENEILALGLPTTILELKARKAALQAECTSLLLEVTEDTDALAADQPLLDQLATVTDDMRHLTSEHSRLVNEASAATKRRVDAVMRAIGVCEEKTTLCDEFPEAFKGDVKS